MAVFMKRNGELVQVGMLDAVKTEKQTLNFSVKGYRSLPKVGIENEIAILTTNPVLNYTMSFAQPENPNENDVWVKLAVSGGKTINVLKINSIVLDPVSVYQYKNETWERSDAYIYINDTWEEFSFYLYSPGNQYSDITGGWTSSGYRQSSGSPSGGAGDGGSYIYCTGKHSRWEGAIGTASLVDLTGYNKLSFEAESNSLNNANCYITSGKSYFSDYIIKRQAFDQQAKKTYTIDISDITGNYYILFTSWSDGGTTKIYNVWLS